MFITQFCKKMLVLVVAVCALVACNVNDNASVVAPINLSIGTGQDHLLGHFEQEPRLSWQLPADEQVSTQTAYQIQVSSASSNIEQAELWDSGVVKSAQTNWVVYQGKPLSSRQEVTWRVRFWDQNEQVSEWSAPLSFELGLLSNADWKAKWIGHPKTALSLKPAQETLATPQYLRTEFTLQQAVKKARLYITSKGLFKSYVNGEEIAPKDVMTPGWTPYHKRIETLTYDVTEQLTQGSNVLAATIAGGWYSGRVYKFTDKDFLKPSRLLAQLEIELADGSTKIITSNDNWLASLKGPIRFASTYDGEHYQQSDFANTWLLSGTQGEQWSQALAEEREQEVKLSPKQHAPIRTVDTLSPVKIVSVEDGKAVFDFGQNMVGVPQINVPAISGQEITMRFAEALNKGEFYTENYRSAKSTNHYLPNESGVINYKPTFTYHGYRYIELSGYDTNFDPQLGWVKALIQHSDVELTANFKSSHTKLNQLAQNVVWGLRSNFYDIPLDCPQRDERLGWTGDAQVFATPSMYMADVYGFWSAWLNSVREDQQENGKIPNYVPYVKWLDFPSSGWGDAATIIPWDLYMATGDETVLKDNFLMMNRWVEFHQSQSKDYVSNMMTFGDWLQPYPVITKKGDKGNRGNTDFSLIGTAYFARSVELTMKAAKVLNKTQDYSRLNNLHQQVKSAFNSHFFDAELNLKQGIATQTTYLLGLEYDLFPSKKRQLAVDHLLSLLQQADNHLRTGFLGTPLLASVLENAGRSDLVYDLIFKETYPSWFYSINNGATTTWERWNSYSLQDGFNPEGMNSLNHYAYGSISRWFYEGMLGIKPMKAGFSEFSISPKFSSKLDNASGEVVSPHGAIKVDWRRIGLDIRLNLTVPKNTIGVINLPNIEPKNLTINGAIQTESGGIHLGAGSYTIEGKLIKLI